MEDNIVLILASNLGITYNHCISYAQEEIRFMAICVCCGKEKSSVCNRYLVDLAEVGIPGGVTSS